MKKKVIIIGSIILVIVVGLIICWLLTKKSMVNKSFGTYKGVYKYRDCEFRVMHNGNEISYMVLKNNENMGLNSTTISGNKTTKDEYDLEFIKNGLKVNSRTKQVYSGVYKKVSGYSTDEIYKDYIGDVSLYNNKYNGKYKLDDYTIYTVQPKNEEVKIYYAVDDEQINIFIEQVGNDRFSTNFFDEKYDLRFDKDTLYFTALDKEGNEKKNSGKYTKETSLTKEEIIKLFLD